MKWIAIVIAFIALSAVVTAAEHTQDSVDTVKKAVSDGKAVIIDVREDSEWKNGHLQDAKHLPLSEIKKGVSDSKLKASIPNGKIAYLHCASGKRCLVAADLLKANGYDVRPLKPGYEELLKAGMKRRE